MALMSMIILLIVLPVNLLMGFYNVAIAWACALVLLVISTYLIRKKNCYVAGYLVYAIGGYVAMFLNFIWNSGIGGPTLIITVLFLALLIISSPRRMGGIWVICHLLFVCGLVAVEYYFPELVPDTYTSRSHHFLDVLFTTTLMLVFMYVTLSLLVLNYDQERSKTRQLAAAIDQKNTSLADMNQKKDRLISILTHDLRGPLGTIKGYLELLRHDDKLLNSGQRQQIEQRLGQMVDGSIDLVENLLVWSKHQQLGAGSKLEQVQFTVLINSVLQTVMPRAEEKGVELRVEHVHEVSLLTDADALQVVFRNLLLNAVKFTPAKGCIVVRYGNAGDRSYFEVEDNGIGIDQAVSERLFTMNPGHSYGTDQEKGSGMGLVLCIELLNQMGGSIDVDSTVGEGSRFRVWLDKAQRTPASVHR